MIRPSPQHDELDRGYWGRVISWNAWGNEFNALKILRRQKENDALGSKQVPLVKVIAEVAGLSTEEFTQKHTTLSIRRGITASFEDFPHGSEGDLNILWSTSIRVSRPAAYFCHECIDADIERHGYSYWRRVHQIPGQFHCPHHQSTLCYVQDDAAYYESPQVFLNQGLQSSPDLCKASQTNPAIRRYQTLAQYFLNRSEPLAVRRIVFQLIEQGKSVGLQTFTSDAKQLLLSDLVIESFGRQWLAPLLPKLAKKPLGEFFKPIDGILLCQVDTLTTLAYLIAISVLFESTEQALVVLENSNAADLANASTASVAERCHPKLSQAAIAFFREEKSLTESAAQFGVPLKQLEHLVRNAGVGFAKELTINGAHGVSSYSPSMKPELLPAVCFG